MPANSHHIFYIQSGIAYAIALSIIKEKSIPTDKVIFLTGRNFQVAAEFQQFNMEPLMTKFTINVFKGWMHLYKVYQFCKEILTQQKVKQFNFYTASNTKTFLIPFFNNSKRIATHFLEEGYSAYFTKEEYIHYVKSNFQSSNYKKYQLKIAANTLFFLNIDALTKIKELETYDSIYTCSPKAFEWIDTPKVVLPNPFKATNPPIAKEITILMALSYPVEKGFISLDHYLAALKEVFTAICQLGKTTIHFKFHPQQTVNSKNLAAYRKLYTSFDPKITFVELPNDTTLEFLFSNEDLILLTDYSSILLYGDSMNITSLSICNILSKHSDQFKNCYHTLPLYSKNIIKKNRFNLNKLHFNKSEI